MTSSKAQIPEGWRLVRLGDVAEVNPRRPRLSVADDIPVTFLPMAAIAENSQGIIVRESRPYSEVSTGYTYFEEKDFLFSKITPCLQNGKHALATGLNGGFGFGTTEFHVVRAGSGLSPQFMFRVLTRSQVIERCSKSFTGTAGQQRVQPEILKDLSILLPPLPEQRAIAAVLDSIDESIEGAEAVIAATEQLRDSLLHQLLTCGVPGWHTEWKDVLGLGTIPADWEVVRLGEGLADGLTNGIYKPESDYGSGTWLIRIDDFIPGALVKTTGFQRIRATEEEVARYSLRQGDILINRVNSLSHIGKSVLIPELDEPTLFESNMMRLTVRTDVHAQFAANVLLSGHSRSYFASRAKKAVQQASINQQDVTQMPFPFPSLPEQQAIAGLLDGVDVAIAEAKRERDWLQLLKESTSDAVLTGRVQVGRGVFDDQ